MQRAIELGKNAMGSTAPNPMVGCCIVYNGLIIGEGFTSPYGGPHAEVNAIHSVRDKSLLSEATLYVTLEPCSHFGKTPPCSDLIIDSKIPHVVVGLKDPNPRVAGKGIDRLRKNGVKVDVGVLGEACREHHKRFLTFQEKKRPYIVLKWAESWDGFLAPDQSMREENPEPYWISNAFSKQLVHRWRSEEQGILVGTQTVLDDNPKLDVRHWRGKNPIRVVLDRSLKIPSNFHVMDGNNKTIVLTGAEKKSNHKSIVFEKVDFDKELTAQILSVLYNRNINSILIEGGAKTLQTFIDKGLWDEARIFRGSVLFTKGVKSPKITGRPIITRSILNDSLTILRNDTQPHT